MLHEMRAVSSFNIGFEEQPMSGIIYLDTYFVEPRVMNPCTSTY
jgi:hypothetical protein